MIKFIHPAPGSYVPKEGHFGWRTISGKREWHQGIDYAKSGHVPILASADGVVRDIWGQHASTYGNVIFLQHDFNGERMDTTYAHLKSILVKKNQRVKQGQIIGYMGNTGRSFGQHLHFEIHKGPWAKGQPNAINPALYVDKKVETPKKKYLVLPATATSWAVYPTNKAPVKANAIGSLNPKKFGGLTYEILGNPQQDVYTIKTSNFGTVNIYAGKSTVAIIK